MCPKYLGRGRLNILSHSKIPCGATYTLKINSILRWALFKLCLSISLPLYLYNKNRNPTDSYYEIYFLIRWRWCIYNTHTIDTFVYGRRLSTLNYFFRLFVLRLEAYFSSSHIKHAPIMYMRERYAGWISDVQYALYAEALLVTTRLAPWTIPKCAPQGMHYQNKKCAVNIEIEKARIHHIRLFLA